MKWHEMCLPSFVTKGKYVNINFHIHAYYITDIVKHYEPIYE